MYYIESGKSAYFELMKQFERQVVVSLQPAVPKCIGIIVAAQNGGWAVSCESELVDGRPKHENPAEMDHPLIGEYGQLTSPGREWFQAAISRTSIVTRDGTVIVDPRENHIFSPPIFDAICRWTEEFFLRPGALFTPAWLIVDEIEAGFDRVWKLGELTIP